MHNIILLADETEKLRIKNHQSKDRILQKEILLQRVKLNLYLKRCRTRLQRGLKISLLRHCNKHHQSVAYASLLNKTLGYAQNVKEPCNIHNTIMDGYVAEQVTLLSKQPLWGGILSKAVHQVVNYVIVIEIVKPLYNIIEVGLCQFNTYFKYSKEKPNTITSIYNTDLLTCKEMKLSLVVRRMI